MVRAEGLLFDRQIPLIEGLVGGVTALPKTGQIRCWRVGIAITTRLIGCRRMMSWSASRNCQLRICRRRTCCLTDLWQLGQNLRYANFALLRLFDRLALDTEIYLDGFQEPAIARAVVKESLRRFPKYSLKRPLGVLRFKDPAVKARIIENLREAGVPE